MRLLMSQTHTHIHTSARLAQLAERQAGYIVGVCNECCIFGDGPGRIIPVEFSSSTIKRVCRSSLAAETNAALEGMEAAIYFRGVLDEMFGLSSDESVRPISFITDARSLHDILKKDCGQVADRRLRLTVAQLK